MLCKQTFRLPLQWFQRREVSSAIEHVRAQQSQFLTQSTPVETMLRLESSLVAMAALDEFARAFPGTSPLAFLSHHGDGGGTQRG